MIASRRVSSNMMERPIRGRTRYLLLRTVAQCISVFRPFPDPIDGSCTADRKRSEVLELRRRVRDGAVLADGEVPAPRPSDLLRELYEGPEQKGGTRNECKLGECGSPTSVRGPDLPHSVRVSSWNDR